MANPLTGDYEAVLQVATRQIAGLLGTLHQNGAQQNNPMTLPHSETGRIGDPRRRPPYGGVVTTGVFAEWVNAYQRRRGGHGVRELETQLTSAAPPGAARMLADSFKALRGGGIVIDPIPPAIVRGLAKMQMSSFGITVAQGSTSEVTVSTALRARYYPDPGAAQLPVPIHGTVQATFKVRKVNTATGPKLIVLPSTDDSKIQFIAAPGSGLTAADQTTLSVEVRKVLRDSMTPAPAALPTNFPFSDFKGLGSGASQVIALPFQLSGAAAPASGLQPLNQSFIGASGFAVAVSSAYVGGLFDLDAIRQALAAVTFTVHVSVGFYSANVTYKLRFTSGPTLTFKSGGIDISGAIAAETDTWWAPNGSVSFTQTIRLMLDVASQTVTPMRFNDPQVDQSWFIPHQTAVNAVKTQINDALIANTPAVRQVFTHGKTTLLNGLSSFDPAARATYTDIDITPDGIVIHGEIGSAPRRPPVAAIAETENASAFTALESWIPAGGIDRFIWSWIEYPSPYGIWNGVEKSFTDAHRFIFPKPAAATHLNQICLRIEGTQISPNGQTTSVAAGTTCSVGELEVAMDLPSWFGPVTLPIWRPNVPETGKLRDAIAAHISVGGSRPGTEPLSRNTLVYFADWTSAKPLESLNTALSKVKNADAVMAVVVLPAGAFDASRREIEARIGASEHRIPIHVTEDDEGGWTRMFAPGKTPAAFLINARRQCVWKHDGEPSTAEWADALQRYVTPTSAPRFRPLRLAVAHGEPAPDAWFEADDKEQFSLQRLRGREILLTFWQSWSAPSLAELSRLQRLQTSAKDAPFIVAVHSGSDDKALEEIRKRLGLTFALVQDSQQRITQQYGVKCWPTTIAIAPDGRAESIQFGAAHDHGATSDKAATSA